MKTMKKIIDIFPLKFRVHGKSDNFDSSVTIETPAGLRLVGLGKTSSMNHSLFLARANFMAMVTAIANIACFEASKPKNKDGKLAKAIEQTVRAFGPTMMAKLVEAGELSAVKGGFAIKRQVDSPVAKKRKRVAPSKTSKKTKKPTKTKGSK